MKSLQHLSIPVRHHRMNCLRKLNHVHFLFRHDIIFNIFIIELSVNLNPINNMNSKTFTKAQIVISLQHITSQRSHTIRLLT